MSNFDNAIIEHAKHQIDYIKHITTLSTGSIVLLATFLERVFLHPTWRCLVTVSVVGFLSSVISAVIAHTIFVGNPNYFAAADMQKGLIRTTAMSSLIVMWFGFLVGIVALGVFAIRNLS